MSILGSDNHCWIVTGISHIILLCSGMILLNKGNVALLRASAVTDPLPLYLVILNTWTLQLCSYKSKRLKNLSVKCHMCLGCPHKSQAQYFNTLRVHNRASPGDPKALSLWVSLQTWLALSLVFQVYPLGPRQVEPQIRWTNPSRPWPTFVMDSPAASVHALMVVGDTSTTGLKIQDLNASACKCRIHHLHSSLNSGLGFKTSALSMTELAAARMNPNGNFPSGTRKPTSTSFPAILSMWETVTSSPPLLSWTAAVLFLPACPPWFSKSSWLCHIRPLVPDLQCWGQMICQGHL